MNPELIMEELLNHRYFRRLLRLIETHPYSDELNSFHSSLIVKGGKILSYGINKPGANSFALNYAQHKGWQLHAECCALYKVRRMNLNGATMYNARVNKHGVVEISKPCLGCSQMLIDHGFRKIVYTTTKGFEIEKVNNLIEVAT